MRYKVKITKLPTARQGRSIKTGQQASDGSLAIQPTALGGADIDQYMGEKPIRATNTIQPVPREEANVEVERGEVVTGDLNGDGMVESVVAGGKRHSEGGTPLDLPDDTFIYSDTRSMRINDKDVLAKYGKSSGSYTPAQLAKQYDVSKYRAILQDPNSDAIDRKTAELMLRNYNMKLGSLALAQESKKGFPQGIPAIAEPYMQANKISPEDIMPDYQPRFAQEEQEVEDAEYEEMPMEMPSGEQIAMSPEMMQQQMPSEFAYGGYIPQAQDGVNIKRATPPYTEQQAYTPSGVKKLNEYRALYGLKPISDKSSKQQIKSAAGELQSKIIEKNPKLVVDYMVKGSHKPNNKLAATLKQKGYAPTNEGVEKAIAAGDLNTDEIKRDYKDEQWWYRAVRAQKKGDLSKEEYEKKIKEEGVIEQDGKYYFRDDTNPDLYYYYDPLTEETKPVTVNEEETEEEVIRPGLNQVNVPPPAGISPAAWTAPDLRNYFGAYKDKASLRKYFPWAASVDLEEPLPTYYDPTRELAQQSEQVNMITQGLGQFAGPQALSSRASQVQATGAKQAADTLARYNNLNVGLANQFEQLQSNVRNQERMMNQGIAKELYDKNVITNQSFDNAKRSADANIRQAFATGWKNASDISMVNATSEQYEVDPRTGTVYFERGKDIRPERAASFDRILQGYIRQGFDPKDAIAAAKVASGDSTGYSGPALASNYKDGGMYVMGSTVFPFMFY